MCEGDGRGENNEYFAWYVYIYIYTDCYTKKILWKLIKFFLTGIVCGCIPSNAIIINPNILQEYSHFGRNTLWPLRRNVPPYIVI